MFSRDVNKRRYERNLVDKQMKKKKVLESVSLYQDKQMSKKCLLMDVLSWA